MAKRPRDPGRLIYAPPPRKPRRLGKILRALLIASAVVYFIGLATTAFVAERDYQVPPLKLDLSELERDRMELQRTLDSMHEATRTLQSIERLRLDPPEPRLQSSEHPLPPALERIELPRLQSAEILLPEVPVRRIEPPPRLQTAEILRTR